MHDVSESPTTNHWIAQIHDTNKPQKKTILLVQTAIKKNTLSRNPNPNPNTSPSIMVMAVEYGKIVIHAEPNQKDPTPMLNVLRLVFYSNPILSPWGVCCDTSMALTAISSTFFAVMLKSKSTTTTTISGIPLNVHIKSVKNAPCTVPLSQEGVSANTGGEIKNAEIRGQGWGPGQVCLPACKNVKEQRQHQLSCILPLNTDHWNYDYARLKVCKVERTPRGLHPGKYWYCGWLLLYSHEKSNKCA